MSEKEKSFLGEVADAVQRFKICGMPGATLDKAVKNFVETGSVLISAEQVENFGKKKEDEKNQK